MYERIVKLDYTLRRIRDETNFTIKIIRRLVYVDKYHLEPKCDEPWNDPESDEYRERQEAREEAELEASLGNVAVA